MNLSGTKDRILDVAERLFAEQGFAATSLRAITTRAKVNLAAIHYHFGSKETLIQAVFRRRLIPLNRKRLEVLMQLEQAAGDRPLAVEQIIEAFIGPALRLSRDVEQGGHNFMRLLGSAYIQPASSIQTFLQDQYTEVVARYRAAFARCLPHVPSKELDWRLHFMLGAMAYTMAGRDAYHIVSRCEPADASDAEAIIKRLVPFLASGFKASAASRIGEVAA